MTDPTTTGNTALVTQFIDALFTRGELDAVDRYLAPDFVNHDPFPGFGSDREGMRLTAQVFRQGFPDWHSRLEAMIAEGDLVPATGREVTLAGINIFRVRDGKLVERWGRTDDLGFLQQLGVVPAMSSR
jgi:predicted SnoaL-like aldol condensation-catalyzing enzyme